MLPAIGRATGLKPVEGPDPAGAVTEHLRAREVLVVLDDAEHLLEAAPGLGRLVGVVPGPDRAGHQPDARCACAASCSTSSAARGAGCGRPRPGGARRPRPPCALFLERAAVGVARTSGSTGQRGGGGRDLGGWRGSARDGAGGRASQLIAPGALLERLDG